MNEQISAFEARYPDIKVTPVISGCGEEISRRFVTSLASGTPFDVAMVWTDTLRTLAFRGALAELDGYLARDQIRKNIWFPSEIQSGEWDGKVYGLPQRTGGDDNNILVYNRDLFAEVGLDPDRPPTTFQELDTVSRRLTRFEGERLVLVPFDFQDEGTYGPLAWVYAGGGRIVTDDGLKTAYASESVLNTLAFLRTYIATHFKGPQNILGGIDAFLNRRVAMQGRGSFRYAEVKARDADFPVGLGLRPKSPASSWTGAHAGTWLFVMPRATKNPEAAWRLLYWLTVPRESAGYFLLRQGRPSPIIAYNQDPRYFEVNPYFGLIPKAIESAAPVPIRPGFAEMYSDFRSTWVKLLRDHSLNPRSLLEDAARRGDLLLAEANRK